MSRMFAPRRWKFTLCICSILLSMCCVLIVAYLKPRTRMQHVTSQTPKFIFLQTNQSTQFQLSRAFSSTADLDACNVRPSCELPGRYSRINSGRVDFSPPAALIFMGESHAGRLGNILFSYASAWSTARRYTELTGRPSCALYAYPDLLSIVHPGYLPIRSVQHSEISDRTEIFIPQDMYPKAPVNVLEIAELHQSLGFAHSYVVLGGFLNGDALFGSHRACIRRLFKPRARRRNELLARFPLLPAAVCLHVRLGDKIDNGNYQTMRGPYYKGALAALGITLPTFNATPMPPLFVAAESASALEHFDFFRDLVPAYGAVVFPGPAEDDLWALSLCGRGIIAASSSYSWWAAYLRENLSTPVVLPRSHYVPAEPSFPGGMFPVEAIVLEADGTRAKPSNDTGLL